MMSNHRAAHQGEVGDRDHHGCEASLGMVNPTTGLANDYLNIFNEIILLLEFLPTMPEMTDEALAWQPRGYREYFQHSPLPGAREAVRRYEQIDPTFRARFESILTRLNEIVVDAQRTVAEEMRSPNFPESIVEPCEATAAAMRAGLAYVARLINEGPIDQPSKKKTPKSTNERKPSHG